MASQLRQKNVFGYAASGDMGLDFIFKDLLFGR